MMLHLRETLTMPSSYYTDITDSISENTMAEMKESVNQSLSKVKRGKSKMLESVSNDKIMSVLKEAKYTDSIVERVVAKLREGGVDVGKQRIYRVPVARINPPGTLNGNHRRYPAELWENVMNNQGDSWKGLCGLADHPTEDTDPGSFKNSSIVWLGMDIDKNSNIVYGIGTFVGPYGHLAQEIIDAGGRVGFSSSGFGELESDGETVNPNTYQIERLADVVLNPSQSVYGSINDETNLGNIEYTKKQAVNESVENNENRIQENTNMDATKVAGVREALADVEEKMLRKDIKKLFDENVEIKNPVQQLKDLKKIQEYINQGQLTDLEDDVKAKLEEAQKRVEDMVEFGMKMKEAEVSIEAGAPEDTKVDVSADGAVNVTVGEAPVAGPVEEPTVDIAPTPAMDEPAEAPVDTTVEPTVGDETPIEPTDEVTTEEPAVDESEDEEIFESKLTAAQQDTIRENIENFLKSDHSNKNPVDLINEANNMYMLAGDSKLTDLQEDISKFVGSVQNQLAEDIASTQKMKNELNVKSVDEINESAKSIMKSGKLLIDQVKDYKELCEALTKRNQLLMKQFNEMKANIALLEAKNEDTDLSKNQKIVSLSEKVNELTENFDNLDVKAGEKVTELQESIETLKKELDTYKEGNAKLEKANGLLKTQLKETTAKLDKASDEILSLKESKVEAPKAEKLTESKVFGPIDTTAFEEMKKENESLKAALATFKESNEKPQALDMTKLDEAAAREIKVLKDENKLLKSRLGESVDNYVKTMEGSVISYYNDLEAKYGEAIKPYKSSFLKARSLREAQRMFMNVVKELQNSEVLEESVETEEVPAGTLSSGKTSDFYEGNISNDTGSFAASFGLK